MTSGWGLKGRRRERRTSGLGEEGNDIARDEDLGEPLRADQGAALAVRQADDAAQHHVDGCGEQGWRDEEEQGLHYVRSQGPIRCLLGGQCAANVADPFD